MPAPGNKPRTTPLPRAENRPPLGASPNVPGFNYTQGVQNPSHMRGGQPARGVGAHEPPVANTSRTALDGTAPPQQTKPPGWLPAGAWFPVGGEAANAKNSEHKPKKPQSEQGREKYPKGLTTGNLDLSAEGQEKLQDQGYTKEQMLTLRNPADWWATHNAVDTEAEIAKLQGAAAPNALPGALRAKREGVNALFREADFANKIFEDEPHNYDKMNDAREKENLANMAANKFNRDAQNMELRGHQIDRSHLFSAKPSPADVKQKFETKWNEAFLEQQRLPRREKLR